MVIEAGPPFKNYNIDPSFALFKKKNYENYFCQKHNSGRRKPLYTNKHNVWLKKTGLGLDQQSGTNLTMNEPNNGSIFKILESGPSCNWGPSGIMDWTGDGKTTLV